MWGPQGEVVTHDEEGYWVVGSDGIRGPFEALGEVYRVLKLARTEESDKPHDLSETGEHPGD